MNGLSGSVWGYNLYPTPMKQKAPSGTKNEGESVRAVERSDRKGLGNTFPNQ